MVALGAQGILFGGAIERDGKGAGDHGQPANVDIVAHGGTWQHAVFRHCSRRLGKAADLLTL